MTQHESWADYLRRITAGLPRKDIAAAAGIDVSGVSRWFNGTSRPSPEKVINFARSLNQSPIEALVAAGYLDSTDITGAVEIVQSLDTLPDDTLVEELRERLRARSAGVADDVEAPLATHWRRPRPSEDVPQDRVRPVNGG